uniref:Uncharacterized protein n=1 Tax=Sus scrofa TaxID=9823 RepID=A0A4X1UCT0_PIG
PPNSFFFFSYFFRDLSQSLSLTALDLNLQYRLSSSTFYCNVMTFLCFLGALLASLVVLHMGPVLLFKLCLQPTPQLTPDP